MSTADEIETLSEDGDPAARALADWRERRDRGETVSLDELCRENPSIASEIRARAAALEVLARHLRPQREPARELPPLRRERYTNFRAAGEGGMGIVYWALDTDLNREVAFKVVRPDAGRTRETTPSAPTQITPPAHGTPASSAFATLKARFLQEAWVTAGMNHPGIVPVYELGQTPEGVPFFTMRFVRGSRTLAKAIDEAKDGPWEARLALLEDFLKICDTIRYAHAQGVVHRDLKPENVAIGEFGEVVVLDWGLAKLEDRADETGEVWRAKIEEFRTGADLKTLASALGTPGYMSPEAALGRTGEIDARTDVYSLGAILYRILTGRLPFEFTSYGELIRKLMEGTPVAPHAIDPAIPESLSNLAVRALSKNRDARPASAGILAQEIRDWQTRSAKDREADAALRDARAGYAAAERLRGADATEALERASSAVAQVERVRPGDASAAELRAAIVRRREVAVAERERIARATTARRGGIAVLGLAAAAGVTFALVLDARRRETEQARDTAMYERDAKVLALGKEQAARERADAASTKARAIGLAHAAAERTRENPALALALARESVRCEAATEGISRLHDALVACRERVRVIHDPAGLVAADFLPDGRIVTASCDGAIRFSSADGNDARDIAAPHAPATVLAVSSADGRFACGFLDGAVGIWSASGERIAELPRQATMIASLEWASDGSRLVTLCGEDGRSGPTSGEMRMWDASGRAIAEFAGAGHASALRLVGNGNVAAGFRDGSLALFDVAGKRVWSVAPPPGAKPEEAPVADIAVLEDGGVAWTHRGGRMRIASSDGVLRVDQMAHESSCRAVRAARGGKRLATLDEFGEIAFWDAAGVLVGRVAPVRTAHTVLEPFSVAQWTPDGTRFLAAVSDGTVRVFRADGNPDGEFCGHAALARSIRFGRDGHTLLTASNDGHAILWAWQGAEDLLLPCGEGRITDVAWSPDGSIVAAAGKAGTVLFRADGRELARFEGQGSRWVSFSPDGRRVLDVCGGAARLFDVASAVRVTLSFPEGGVTFASFSPDGTKVLALPSDKTARLFGLDGQELCVLRGHESDVVAACFAPDGQSVATAAHDSTVRRWSLSGELLETYETAGRRAISVAFAADGTLAAGFMDAEVRVWPRGTTNAPPPRVVGGWVRQTRFLPDGHRMVLTNLSDSAVITSADLAGPTTLLRGHTARVTVTACSPDGFLVATGSEDGTARVFGLDGGELMTLAGHLDSVTDVAFSPDGRRLATASADGTVRTWFVRVGELLDRSDARSTRLLTGAELARYHDLLGEDDRLRLRGVRVAADTMTDLLLREDARAAIAARTDLDAATRDAAVAELSRIAEHAYLQGRKSWELSLRASANEDERARALRLARSAVHLRGDVADFWNTFSLALLRSGRTDEAAEALRNAQERRHPPGATEDDELVASLVDAARGAKAEGREALDRAKAAYAKAPRGAAEIVAPLIAEAERALLPR